MRKVWLPLLFLGAILMLVSGCSDSPISTDSSGTINLEDEFGGYRPTSEAPAFGDGELMADDDLEIEVDDPILSSAAVTDLTADPESGLFHLRAVWGKLRYDSTVTTVTDWTGSLTITSGAEVIRRKIRFEEGQDYILDRTDRKLIEWVSATTVHNDGLAIDLFIPRPRPTFDSIITFDVDSLGDSVRILTVDTIMPEPVMVTFTTGPYSRTFGLAELAKLDTVVELDDGNAVAFHAMVIHRTQCNGGFLAGHWGYDDEGQGLFRGRWMSNRGNITGWLNGHFGVNDEGRNVLFGKWVNRSGEFEGFLRGTYGTRPDPNATDSGRYHGGGYFKAEIFDSERSLIGHMGGRYRSAEDRRGGFFQGRWKPICENITDRPFGYEDGMDRGMGDGFRHDGGGM